jgi:hypothetical protein
MVDAVSTNPVSSATASFMNVLDYALKDRSGAAQTRQEMLTLRAGRAAEEVRNIRRVLGSIERVGSVGNARISDMQTSGSRQMTSTGLGYSSKAPSPGGVSTREFAQAFVDRGEWPVLTVFGLAYAAGQ